MNIFKSSIQVEYFSSKFLFKTGSSGRDPVGTGLRESDKKKLVTTYSPVPALGTVPSALVGLTSLFGKGRGVAPPLLSPVNLLYLAARFTEKRERRKIAKLISSVFYKLRPAFF